MEEDIDRVEFAGEYLRFKSLSFEQIMAITRGPRPDYRSAFYGDAGLKQRFIERAADHKKADQIQHGVYWTLGEAWNKESGQYAPKLHGCAVGCLSHAGERAHQVLSRLTNVPQALYQLTDTLFESQSILIAGLDKALPGDIMAAIPVGSDQSETHYRVMARLAEKSEAILSDWHRRKLVSTLTSDAPIATKFAVLQEAVTNNPELKSYGITTLFWDRFCRGYNPVEVRQILLEELRNAPVPVVEKPEEQQTMAAFMTTFVMENEKVTV